MQRLIESRRYNSKSEIIREGLRLVEDREADREARIEALRRDIQIGIDSGPGIPIEEVRAELSAQVSRDDA